MNPIADKDFFRGKPLQACIEYLEKLLASSEEKEDALPALNALIENLVETNRMFDIASIYIFLKSAAVNGREIGFFYEHANRVLKHHINDLFTKSITYNNTELRETFSDILGNDTGRLMELVSFIFRKYRLFDMKFSDNIHKQLIKVAEKDIHSFIEHADSNFLAFYLSTLPELGFVSRDHIEHWIHIILYQIDGERYSQKILDAMQIHPSFNFLLIFMLSPREHDRFRALSMMKKALSQRRRDNSFRNIFIKNSPYFIKKAVVESAFYDFHEIPIAHKELFSQLVCFTDGKPVKEVIIPLLKTENPEKDQKITESKLAFVPAIACFADEFPDLRPLLTVILRDPAIEIEVKEAIRKIVYGTK